MQFTRAAALSLLLALSAASPAAAAALTVNFRLIDSVDATASSLGEFDLNNLGDVAYRRGLPGEESIVLNRGGVETIVAEGSPTILVGDPNVNDLGTVSYFRRATSNDQSIWFWRDGAARQVITTVGSEYRRLRRPTFDQALNNNDQYAFRADANTSAGQVIDVLSGGAFTRIAENGGGVLPIFGGPSINDSGDLAYLTFEDDVIETIVSVVDGVSSTIAREVEAGLDFQSRATINNAGAVSYSSIAFDPIAGDFVEGGGLYLHTGGATQLIADTAGQFFLFGSPSLNDRGEIAFLATLDDGRRSLNVFSAGIISTIIATGDLLDGFIVSSFLNRPVINNRGEIAFSVILSDGTQRLYTALTSSVATVPAPGAIAAFGTGLAAFAAVRRRRRSAVAA